MKIYLNADGVECVIITNDDGTIWSGLKSAYDDEQAKAKADDSSKP